MSRAERHTEEPLGKGSSKASVMAANAATERLGVFIQEMASDLDLYVV
jgi:hypothetical protein